MGAFVSPPVLLLFHVVWIYLGRKFAELLQNDAMLGNVRCWLGSVSCGESQGAGWVMWRSVPTTLRGQAGNRIWTVIPNCLFQTKPQDVFETLWWRYGDALGFVPHVGFWKNSTRAKQDDWMMQNLSAEKEDLVSMWRYGASLNVINAPSRRHCLFLSSLKRMSLWCNSVQKEWRACVTLALTRFCSARH